MNMMDSVFYLGLVVTFLLILLVVYHFKNRVTTMEQRCDTMFEIMNNIVQELNLLRRQQNITLGGGVPVNITTSTNEEVYNDHSRQEDEEEDEESEYETDDESSYSSEEDLEEDLEPENRVVELENELNPEESPSPDTMQSLLLDIDDNNSMKIDKVETTLENDEVHESDESNMDAYKSMTNSALKALVIDKGLSTNPSKLKKTELLDLLKELE
jgi:hypothetical protein